MRGDGGAEWEGRFTLCGCWTRTDTRMHYMHQMAQEAGFNKHASADVHVLAERRLDVHCPLMNVYWESEGPRSFS